MNEIKWTDNNIELLGVVSASNSITIENLAEILGGSPDAVSLQARIKFGRGTKMNEDGTHRFAPSYKKRNRRSKKQILLDSVANPFVKPETHELPFTKKEVVAVAEPMLVEHDGEVYATSLNIAEVFGMKHGNVTAKIKSFSERGLLNFQPSSYQNEQNKSQPMYEMNRDGLIFLVGKFTGEKAEDLILDYIDLFNEMETALKSQSKSLTTGSSVMDGILNGIATAFNTAVEAKDTAVEALDLATDVKTSMDEATLSLAEAEILDNHKKKIASKYSASNPITMREAQITYSRAIKKHFDTSSYKQIKSSDLKNAIDFVSSYIPE